ncbi:MAG: aminotransferase class V-fold PLP-dependent enzyme [Bacteroidales bacterium]|nr:aminotransferase class V-fold PLP-dependent enzyme [Bacteroidales bacterium]
MMCAEPLMERFGQSGMLRASLAPYNTLEECKFFMTALHRAVNMLR